jgi:hypothetical protein
VVFALPRPGKFTINNDDSQKTKKKQKQKPKPKPHHHQLLYNLDFCFS